MAIRYDKKLNQEIDRTVKNFNQKVARLERQLKTLVPAKISKSSIKESVTSRTDLKRKLKELQKYSERGIEEVITTSGGTIVTKYELDKIKRESVRLKKKISREINILKVEKPKVFGKKQAKSFAEMGDEYFLNLVARRNALEKEITSLSPKEFQRYKELLYKTEEKYKEQSNKFKIGYYVMLTDLAYLYNYDEGKLKVIEDKLMSLPTDKFIKLFNEDKSIKAIIEYYIMRVGNPSGIDPEKIREDVTSLYDNLYENIDEIIKDYKT